jgi:energy-coupling factor transporter ATP-binding protein EcfA2
VFLKTLQIKGFKSFADPATLTLEPGVTVVVGPNGSGKSNVVDALGWVLGAQAPSAVRSQKMDDVIFAGSSKYSPASFAEVTLVMENTNGKHIHIAGAVARPAEIQLTRKLYRNGETEYRINGEPASLRTELRNGDVIEVETGEAATPNPAWPTWRMATPASLAAPRSALPNPWVRPTSPPASSRGFRSAPAPRARPWPRPLAPGHNSRAWWARWRSVPCC